MTFPRPCRRTCPQPLPTSPPPPPAPGPRGEGRVGSQSPPTLAGGSFHPSPTVSGSGCPQVAGAELGAHLEGRG